MNFLPKFSTAMVGAGAVLGMSLLPAVALSADGKANPSPWLSAKVPMEWQNDYNYRSDTAGAEVNNMTLVLEPEVTINVLAVPGLSFFIHGVLEQVADGGPNEDRYFKDEGFFIEDLFVQFETGRFGFRSGKMNPGFGIAWDQAPGIYGADMAEDYEVAERIALSASAGLEPDGLGSHKVTASTFFLDTSVLQNTIYSRTRGTLDRSDGGVSNTGDFSSLSVTLDGGEFPAAPDLAYHLAYIHQANGRDATEDESGFAAAVTTKFDVGNDVALSPLFEVVSLNDVGGTKGTDRLYWTASALAEWRNWNLALAYTRRETEAIGAVTVDVYQGQASIGHAFDFGLTADFGWKRFKEAGAFTDTIGFLFTYELGVER